MAPEPSDVREPLAAPAAGASAADLMDRLARFEGPPEVFLRELLATQCALAPAEAGAVFRVGAEGRIEVLTIHPAPEADGGAPPWLAEALEAAKAAIAGGAAVTRSLHQPGDLYGQPARQHVVAVPLKSGAGVRGATAFVVDAAGAALEAARDRLEHTRSLLATYEVRLTLARRQADLARLQAAVETLAAVNEAPRFKGTAMAFVNEVAARWGADQAALGFLRGRYVRLEALSHTEKFSRKMAHVQALEAAMEECLDQDVEVLQPAPRGATCVSRAAAELARRHGPMTVVSLPVRHAGETVAVVTVERPAEAFFEANEVETLRLACDLCAARLAERHEADRWVGARAASGVAKGAGSILGPEHAWLKLGAIAVLAAACFLVFAKGTYRVEAPFVLEAVEQQVIPAPFEGFLKTVEVQPGDVVEAGTTVLGTLRTAELRLELASLKAERVGYEKQAAAALDQGKTVEAQMAEAQMAKLDAESRILEHRLDQAVLTSPLAGRVVSGDIRSRVGGPVTREDVLFEVAPVEALRARLKIPEEAIADVEALQEGELATVAGPADRVPFTIERITPVAEVVDGENVFEAEARLGEVRPGMRPGMEGIAKIEVGRRPYVWIWTRRLVNWVRMKLWV